ncbi:hypothetical protein Godav_011501 [Gossypium davidsonii]|uniref:N-acetyltransferase domain-containing protein n=1 Tax=Gossypium davidsonii TaxID=34287 RepID=A0A7J8RA28_GOSDV|nr:hypothetical protein [Gossypium davidsonii]
MGAGREVAISLDGVRDKNVMQLKKLNTALFPVRYNDKYYADALASGEFTKLGLLLIKTLAKDFLILEFAALHWRAPIELDGLHLFTETYFVLTITLLHANSAYYSDICVGSIACRLEKKEGGAIRVYIMTLGVLAPYRGLGIGTRLLNHVLDLCSKQKIPEIYLHVQTNNEDAINFYKKFGFEITETIKNYYTNIDPPDCFVLTKFTAPSQAKK